MLCTHLVYLIPFATQNVTPCAKLGNRHRKTGCDLTEGILQTGHRPVEPMRGGKMKLEEEQWYAIRFLTIYLYHRSPWTSKHADLSHTEFRSHIVESCMTELHTCQWRD